MKKLHTNLVDYLSQKSRVFFRKHSLPRWMVFAFDGGAVILTFLFSYILRYNFELQAFSFALAIKQSLLVLGVFSIFEFIFRSFSGLIRHTTIQDIFNVLLTTTMTLFVLMVFTFAGQISNWKAVFDIPGSILIINYVSLNAVLIIARISIKMFYEMVSVKSAVKKNIVIYGAGAMGVVVKRVVSSDAQNEYNIVAFLDSDKKLQRKNLDGIPVFNPTKLSSSFIEKNKVETMVFAINDILASRKREIYSFAVDLGLEVLQVPVISDWLNGSLPQVH